MSDKVYLNSHFGYREDTLENWEAQNPVLERGEPAIVRDGTDGRWLKIGDGVTPFGALPWKMGPKGERGIKGEQGIKGDKGDIGVSGVYVGSGEMPEGYNVQIDPNGSLYDLPVTDQTYSPESENAQSGIAVAEAVSGKADIPKDYELIETITLAENTKVIYRDKEPNGKGYNFKKLLVIVTMASGGSGNAYFDYTSNGWALAYFLLQYKNSYGLMKIEDGRFSIESHSNASEYTQFQSYSTITKLDKIDKLRITANGTLLAGSKFTIYGVRA